MPTLFIPLLFLGVLAVHLSSPKFPTPKLRPLFFFPIRISFSCGLSQTALPLRVSETPPSLLLSHFSFYPKMPTLAQVLATTTPVSPLLRKARRLGINGVDALISLAVARGCLHYAPGNTLLLNPPSRETLGDDELTILLIMGENPHNPTAIRCAAQLARSPRIAPARIARLAIMEKCERVLGHIARAGLEHDREGLAFWNELLNHLSSPGPRPEPNLPHWTRFVSMPGRQRHGNAPTVWLAPHP